MAAVIDVLGSSGPTNALASFHHFLDLVKHAQEQLRRRCTSTRVDCGLFHAELAV